MKWYRIDNDRLIWLLLPRVLRGNILIAFLRSLLFPLNRLYTIFTLYRAEVNYKLIHHPQVCYIEAVLNDSFDTQKRRIYIADAPLVTWISFLWAESEDRPVMIKKVADLTGGEGLYLLQGEKFIESDSIDFIVYVPSDINMSNNDTIKMNALLRYYKLAGKRYEIQAI